MDSEFWGFLACCAILSCAIALESALYFVGGGCGLIAFGFVIAMLENA